MKPVNKTLFYHILFLLREHHVNIYIYIYIYIIYIYIYIYHAYHKATFRKRFDLGTICFQQDFCEPTIFFNS